MQVFTYKKIRGCYFTVGKYNNGNTRVDIEAPGIGPITKVTMECSKKLAEDLIAVNDYKENEGIAELLLLKGIVNKFESSVHTGRQVLLVYRLTDKGRRIILGE